MKMHSSQALNRFFDETPWHSKAHRAWFILCSVCLAGYTAYVTCFGHSGFLVSRAQTLGAVLSLLAYAVAVFCVFLWALKRWGSRAPGAQAARGRMCPRVFALSAGITLVILGFAFLECYPGGVSYDAANQWGQVQSGEFNNWHPVFHTLLVWLVTRVHNSYPFAVLMQLLAFSAALGYVTAALHQHGVPAWLAVGVSALVALSDPVKNSLMYLWKDNAMTIGCLVLLAQCVHMLYTRGQWLQKPRNAVAFGLALALTTMTRHNAMLFTLPLFLLAAGCYGLRKSLTAGVTCGLCLLLVQGALFGALDIVYPDNTVEESVGIPMMILANCKQAQPDKLDGEAAAFLATLAPDEAWQTVYRRSDYNAIKFSYPRELIKNKPVGDILLMALRTANRAPRLAFETFNEVTGLVWDVTGKNEGYETVSNSGDLENARYSNSKLHAIGSVACALLEAPMDFLPLSWLTRNIGVQQLLLLLAALWALYRLGVRALMFALPTLCYNLATMLLLCGNDARFFQFTMAVSLPAILALSFAPASKEL